jgi:hypothetical protein
MVGLFYGGVKHPAERAWLPGPRARGTDEPQPVAGAAAG